MNIYGGLIFNQGHVQDPRTGRMLAEDARDGARPDASDAISAPAAPGARGKTGRGAHGASRIGADLQAVLLSACR